ncbi:tRNA (adenosine(37)-N6)-threonylcarbamoyltransferase complex dimerization subunit type 1 TsaB [Candidatus Saccharibacteria bacterium]|nr:tRNA (adenosine(37)-N6)-threonylcarbamoyltransferase complex dimerization subunit type 1 TsaB [Candidatus Saccharibacteria bacterium]
MILAIRTDKPEAELHLCDTEGQTLASYSWEAHRTLAGTLVQVIKDFLQNNKTATEQLSGIIVFSGAGSFTGLRIGATVANALAYAHSIPVVAGEGTEWIADGLTKLKSAESGHFVVPTYDREPNITKPKN